MLSSRFSYTKRLASLKPLTPLILFFIAVFWIASMGGDFPLNDDWSYGESTRSLLATGKLYMPAACAAAFAHIYWGALLAKLFGMSYAVLRFASVLGGLVGAVFVYLSAREIGLKQSLSSYCTLLYAANPILVNLYLGFMSDVTALAFSAAYFYFFLAALRRSSIKHLACALLCLLTAISVRQSAVVLALAAPAIMFSQLGGVRKKGILTALMVALPLLTFWSVDHWLMLRESTGQSLVDHYSAARAGHGSFLKGFWQTPVQQLLKTCAAAGVVFCYQGLFCAPLLLAALFAIVAKILGAKKIALANARPVWLAVLFSIVVCVTSAIYEGKVQHALMPFCENILRITSVGAQGIMGIANPLLTHAQKIQLTVVSYILAGLALAMLTGLTLVVAKRLAGMLKSARLQNGAAQAIVLVTSCLATTGFLTVETIVRCTDRYYLIALMPVVLSLGYFLRVLRLRFGTGIPGIVSSLLLVLFVCYSLFAGQDYIAGNAARWQALNQLEGEHIKSASIDGGAEYNVLRDINVYASHFRGAPPRDTWRWWPIRGEEYIVSFSPVPAYEEKFRVDYFSFLTMSKHSVYALKALPVDKAD